MGFIAKATGLSRTAVKDMIRERGLERRDDIPVLKGQVPYGWRVVNGRLVPHKGEQQVITQLAKLRCKGLSYGMLAAWLNDSGIESKNGGAWDRPTVYKILARHDALKIKLDGGK